MDRRGFLKSILAAGVAPAYVRSASLMRWTTRASGLVMPEYVVVNCIADLRALSPLVKKVFVRGYECPGDGGAAAYIWQPSDTSADNSGVILPLGFPRSL